MTKTTRKPILEAMDIIITFQPFRYLTNFVALVLISTFSTAAIANDAPISINRIPVCMNFGCKTKEIISLSDKEWKSVANWLQPNVVDAHSERENIQKAIGWMEVLVGRHTPTHRDVGGDLKDNAKFPGQLDCIDEANNTTTYLQLFEENGLLQHHKVVEQAYRRAIFDQHWAGQIETLETGERWVVDSWFQNNGHLPYLQLSSEWEDIPFFTSYLDSSQPQPDKKESLLRRIFN